MTADLVAIAKDLRLQADLLDPPVTPAPVTGYVGRSTPDATQWTLAEQCDFPTLVSAGAMFDKTGKGLGPYADVLAAYPTSYQTTDHQGIYDPANVGVIDTADGSRVMNCALRAPINGAKPSGAAPFVAATGTTPWFAESLKGEIRVRLINPQDHFHIANLLWPQSADNGSKQWPMAGEIDFWEQDALGTVGAFLHRMDATSGSDQDAFSTSVKPTDWHVVGFEWISGKSYKMFLDGKQVGSTITSRVPTGKFRPVFQCETSGIPTHDMAVQYDWYSFWTLKA